MSGDSGSRPTQDPREAEWREDEAAALRKRICPYSGLHLHGFGQGRFGNLSCSVCDCFGYDRSEVDNA